MSRRKDERENDKRSRAERSSKQKGEPGGEDPGGHPFDREVHPADERASRADSGKRPSQKR